MTPQNKTKAKINKQFKQKKSLVYKTNQNKFMQELDTKVQTIKHRGELYVLRENGLLSFDRPQNICKSINKKQPEIIEPTNLK